MRIYDFAFAAMTLDFHRQNKARADRCKSSVKKHMLKIPLAAGSVCASGGACRRLLAGKPSPVAAVTQEAGCQTMSLGFRGPANI